MFLKRSDYSSSINTDDLETLLEGEDLRLLNRLELVAQEEAESRLRSRFDVAAIFTPVPVYKAATAYPEGASVWAAVTVDGLEREQVFTAKALAPAGTGPADDPDGQYWEPKDPRNPLLVEMLVDIVLYHLHSKIMPSRIPELRITRYDAAIGYLDKCNKGILQPSFPLRPEQTQENTFTVLSQPPMSWHY